MPALAFRILNVFADTSVLSGNALVVIEDARNLDDAAMQALALQFNVNETTFVLPSKVATARVRIFTPSFEMPFAGHPTLGTAHVVREIARCGDQVTLEMAAGVIPVSAQAEVWTLQANAPRTHALLLDVAQLASQLALASEDIAGPALWVNTGNEQLLAPLASSSALKRCRPTLDSLAQLGAQRAGDASAPAKLFVWHAPSETEIDARFFFANVGQVGEDYGTGSACANLGGYLLATNLRAPFKRSVRQGDAISRPSRLSLEVDASQSIFVAGRVLELGRGIVHL